jgi:DNA excision repair protein ERCC-1
MRVSISLDFTLILSWTSEEAGRYLETFKSFENKPADLISEKAGNTPFEIVGIEDNGN